MTNYYTEYFNDEDELLAYIMFEVEPKNRKYVVRDIRINGQITGYELKVFK